MSNGLSTSPKSIHPRPPLQRKTERRRLGGVCAGLAEYLGMSVSGVRLLFLLSFFFGGLGFWVYLILWLVLPADPGVPMPEVSWALGRELRRMDQKVRKLHRHLNTEAAMLVQETFDAVKMLAPYLEAKGTLAADDTLRAAMLERLPKLLDRLLSLPGRGANASRRGSPTDLVLGDVVELRDRFLVASEDFIRREFRSSLKDCLGSSPDLVAWQEHLAPLLERLRGSVGGATLEMLESIEEKLAFLLERLGGGGNVLLDLRPFEVRKIAYEYLPDTLNQYLALPPSLTQTEKLASGKTAEEALNEQLGLLDTALLDLARSLYQKDAQGLVVHGRFLKEKFAEQPFRLGE